MACDRSSGLCVRCTATSSGACTLATPVCGVDHECRACAAHPECVLSNVCLPNGSCALPNRVAYVSRAGTGTTCAMASPCPLLQDAIAKGRSYVKVDASGAANATAPVTLGNVSVTIFADPGATISRDGIGPIVDIVGTANITMYDLRLTGANGNGIALTANGGVPSLALTRVTVSGNTGTGIASTGAAAITVTRARISNNQGGGISAVGATLSVLASEISGNQGGGIYAGNSNVTLTNNMIVHNGVARGSSPTAIGGVKIQNGASGNSFEWNTVAFNESSGTYSRGGLSCSSASPFPASGNLVYRNGESDGAGGIKIDATTQLESIGCTFGNSLVLAIDASHLGFASPLVLPYDFHLTSASPASVIDAGGTCTGVDIDDQPRPAGGACDLGADERAP